MKLNKRFLERKEKTIFDVIGKMEILLDYYNKSKYTNLSPFLETYIFVTKNVAQKNLKKQYYNNPKELEKLDIYFASTYFNPIYSYIELSKYKSPWKKYLKYCERKDSIPFVQMLLGINAHINYDLVKTIINTKYNERKDFIKINNILNEVIPDIMKYLAFEKHDIIAASGIILKRFINDEFHQVIVKWREDAWKNAQKVKKDKKLLTKINAQTEDIARKIIEIFHNNIDPIKMTREINKLRVKL